MIEFANKNFSKSDSNSVLNCTMLGFISAIPPGAKVKRNKCKFESTTCPNNQKRYVTNRNPCPTRAKTGTSRAGNKKSAEIHVTKAAEITPKLKCTTSKNPEKATQVAISNINTNIRYIISLPPRQRPKTKQEIVRPPRKTSFSHRPGPPILSKSKNRFEISGNAVNSNENSTFEHPGPIRPLYIT